MLLWHPDRKTRKPMRPQLGTQTTASSLPSAYWWVERRFPGDPNRTRGSRVVAGHTCQPCRTRSLRSPCGWRSWQHTTCPAQPACLHRSWYSTWVVSTGLGSHSFCESAACLEVLQSCHMNGAGALKQCLPRACGVLKCRSVRSRMFTCPQIGRQTCCRPPWLERSHASQQQWDVIQAMQSAPLESECNSQAICWNSTHSFLWKEDKKDHQPKHGPTPSVRHGQALCPATTSQSCLHLRSLQLHLAL